MKFEINEFDTASRDQVTLLLKLDLPDIPDLRPKHLDKAEAHVRRAMARIEETLEKLRNGVR